MKTIWFVRQVDDTFGFDFDAVFSSKKKATEYLQKVFKHVNITHVSCWSGKGWMNYYGEYTDDDTTNNIHFHIGEYALDATPWFEEKK